MGIKGGNVIVQMLVTIQLTTWSPRNQELQGAPDLIEV
jgi:hypothetical protein